MKILILFLLFSLNVYSQLSLNNSIGFNFNDNSAKTYSGNLSSNNSWSFSHYTITNSTNQVIVYNDKIIQNEFSNKLIFDVLKNQNSLFLTNQINYSLTRNWRVSNLNGVGIGRRDSILGFKINYSYAILYERINNQNTEYLRHSIRLKLSKVINKINITSEYYYQPDMLNKENVTIYGTTKLGVKINDNISLSVTDIYNYYKFSNVRTIHTLTFGIAYVKK
jgi:hypothetical protein